ncbi:MAG: glycosyltransferase [Chitinophagaceae bacterium]|nr:glycosyltransferase [Chitinophagaceae bacterium]
MSVVRVTILMPAYNAGAYISEAISSVLLQDYQDYELLVVNNGSTDDTVEEILSFHDPRIRLINENRNGIAYALNTGLGAAKGELIARFDADDICTPDRLSRQVDFFDSNPGYILCGSDAEYISETGEHLFNFQCIGHSHEEIMERLYEYCPFIHSSVMYKKSAVIEAGGYSIDAHNFEDYLLWVRMMGAGKYFNLSRRLLKVRFNPASVTIDEKWRGPRFRQLKKNIIGKGFVTPDEGDELLSIIRDQDNGKIKQGAYYALCGKKFLVNNHQPVKARVHLAKAIRVCPSRLDNYLLYVLSYFPKPVLNWLHSKTAS